MKKTPLKVFFKTSAFLVVLLLCTLVPAKVYSLETLWHFRVPVLLNNMPGNAKFVVIHWWVLDDDINVIYNDFKVFPTKLNQFGNAKLSTFVKVYDVDVKEPEKARYVVFRLKLSDNGASVYEVNTNGLTWTQSKEGTTYRVLTAIDLKTLHKTTIDFNPTVENPDWKIPKIPPLPK